MATSWLANLGQELPPGWIIQPCRPHGLLEAISRPSATALHVVVAKNKDELLAKLNNIGPVIRDPDARATRPTPTRGR